MTYVLDTNAVSVLMQGNEAVVQRLASYVPADVAIPQPVIAEIAYGIERLPRSRGGAPCRHASTWCVRRLRALRGQMR